MKKVVVATSLLFWCGTAHAHLVNTGLGPVYDGVSHLFVTFDDLLPVVAMAMLAGLNGPAAGRRTLFALPVAWFAAGLAGHLGGTAFLPAGITSISLLALGILTAADRRLAPGVVTAIAALLGALHGWRNGAGLAAAGREASGLVGIAGAVFVLTALLGAAIVSLRPPWTRIAVRAAGSWIAAIGLLYLGWALSGRL
ncbi:MAG TPA: HupE/UreJ family protein [Candidatus Polarisedimenticolaceae bacterium]